MNSNTKTIDVTLYLLCSIAMLFTCFLWWKYYFKSSLKHSWSALLITIFFLSVYYMPSDIYLGNIILSSIYRFLLVATLCSHLIIYRNRHIINFMFTYCIFIIIIISATLVRYTPQSNAFNECMVREIAKEVDAYYQVNTVYPTDIYAKGENKPSNLKNGLINNIRSICRRDERFRPSVPPLPATIRYTASSNSYKLESFYRITPFSPSFSIYRSCTYHGATRTLSCGWEFHQPFPGNEFAN